MEFMKDMASKPIRFLNEQGKEESAEGMPGLSLLHLKDFKEFIANMKTRGKGEHPQDSDRRSRRKRLMELETYEQKEFLPRDLTQTSQLVRLAAQILKRAFSDCKIPPTITSLPGSVTGTVRKSWNVTGCLSLANTQVMEDHTDENGKVVKRVKTKTEIRDITHLHHALDACVLGLASHFLPNKSLGGSNLWELIVKRHPNKTEKTVLRSTGFFDFDAKGNFGLIEIPGPYKEQIRQRLAEKRVVQHVPARMDGLRIEQNTWRVVSVKDGEATIQQCVRGADGILPPLKDKKEKVGKLLGLNSGKLKNLKGALVIPDNLAWQF